MTIRRGTRREEQLEREGVWKGREWEAGRKEKGENKGKEANKWRIMRRGDGIRKGGKKGEINTES